MNKTTSSNDTATKASDTAKPVMEIKPLSSKNAYSCMLTTEHVTAMCAAMRSAGCFTVVREDGTVRAHHTASKREVFAAIQKGVGQPWIIRHHNMLFA